MQDFCSFYKRMNSGSTRAPRVLFGASPNSRPLRFDRGESDATLSNPIGEGLGLRWVRCRFPGWKNPRLACSVRRLVSFRGARASRPHFSASRRKAWNGKEIRLKSCHAVLRSFAPWRVRSQPFPRPGACAWHPHQQSTLHGSRLSAPCTPLRDLTDLSPEGNCGSVSEAAKGRECRSARAARSARTPMPSDKFRASFKTVKSLYRFR